MATESERRTRRERVDPRVRRAGWTSIVPFAPPLDSRRLTATAVEEFETANGPADYALCSGGGILGVVEAKRLAVGPTGVLGQAGRYSEGVQQEPRFQGRYGVPFLYSTNGEKIRFHDCRDERNLSREVAHFHSPAALREQLGRDCEAELVKLAGIPLHQGLRGYQHDANAAIERALAERRRTMLLAMATGTGKTLTMVNEVYRLMKAGVARRVLFLVDRRALAAQAVQAFASFEAEPGQKFTNLYEVYSQRFHRADLDDDRPYDPSVMPSELLTDPPPGSAFVYVATIQRITMNVLGGEYNRLPSDEELDDDAQQLDIPIHAFDLIVADECHRGYSGKERAVWRQALDHFDAVKIGLTATPAAHTVAYFGAPVFTYDYERAVREGHLVDYDVVKVTSDVRMHGVFLREGEQVDEVDTETGASVLDLLEDERSFEPGEVERRVTAPDSNRKILGELRAHAEAHERETGRFPKTLIFAANDLPHTSHADALVELARDAFGRGEGFVQKITGQTDRPLQRIKEFRNRPKPGIVVTVDLLSTGVDIPNLEWIVFLRTVQSRILFEQMLGRGTRKGDLSPPKTHFTVFDCFDGTLLAYFRQATGMTVEPPEGDNKSVSQIIEEIWQNKDRDYNVRRLTKRLRRIDKEMSGEARELFAALGVPDGDVGAFAGALPRLLAGGFSATMATLRSAELQRLLVEYPKARQPFYVATEVVDTVTSARMIRDGAGKEYRPEDYLTAFGRFVREKAGEIAALGILLERPGEWGPGALQELRRALLAAPERFSATELQRAHAMARHKALADILSMVKHAAAEESPLLTAEERVELATGRVTAGVALTVDQTRWLGYIAAHLVENLSIEREDFDAVPVLSDRGGWGAANRAFGGRLVELVGRLNEALAAA